MARRFDPGSSQCYYTTTAPNLTDYPCTFASWFFWDDLGGIEAILSVRDASNAVLEIGCMPIGFPTTFPCVYIGTTVGGWSNSRYQGISYASWHSIIGVFNSATNRTIYYDAATGATDAVNKAFIGTPNRVTIGAQTHAWVASYFDGAIAYSAIWDVALTSSERSSLAAGSGRCGIASSSA